MVATRAPSDARERSAALANRNASAGIIHIQRSGERGRAGLPDQTSELRRVAEISTEVFAPRRTARRGGKSLDASLERGAVRGKRLRGCHDQLPRLGRLWTEVHRLDQWRLGRQAVRRSDEG